MKSAGKLAAVLWLVSGKWALTGGGDVIASLPNKKGARRRPFHFPLSPCPLAHVTLATHSVALSNDSYPA
jgi:hypothetical protein